MKVYKALNEESVTKYLEKSLKSNIRSKDWWVLVRNKPLPLSKMHWTDSDVLETAQIILRKEKIGVFKKCLFFISNKKGAQNCSICCC